MTRRRTLSRSMAELAVAAPQVVAHRLARIAVADQPEIHRMSHEKVAAFWESWAAMGWQAIAVQQRAWLAFQASLWQGAWLPLAAVKPSTGWMTDAASQWQRGALEVLQHGLAPVHKRALANAKRLGAQRF
jgi:hypothetical protein